MVEVRMVRTGLTIGGQVRRQGEVFKLLPGYPVSVEEQNKHYSKGIWYVEVDSVEEKMVLAMGGMVKERDAFSTDQVVKPGFAPADESPPGMVTEQVPEQPTDEEMDAEMVGDPEAVVETSVVENLNSYSRKKLRSLIDEEGLEVEYNSKTNKKALIKGIEKSRGD